MIACASREQERWNASPQTTPAKPVVTASAAPSSPPWLTVDTAGRTVTLSLEVTARAGARSALINGYRAGDAQVVIPFGWTVRWVWRNSDPGAGHTLVVMVQREKVPLEGGRPAFSNAMTRMVTAGLPPGQSDQTTFEADEAGWYWLLCGVPNHALDGEWLELQVDREAKTANVRIKKRER
jgi:FtsP/CotA-like multicopper oxidase with cupredoxin domain